jgi:hypothetical protein
VVWDRLLAEFQVPSRSTEYSWEVRSGACCALPPPCPSLGHLLPQKPTLPAHLLTIWQLSM